MNRKKNIVILLIIFSLFAGTVFSNAQTNGNEGEQTDENLFMILKKEGNEANIQTLTLLDDMDNLHYFVLIEYENETFFIVHVINGVANLVVRDEFFEEPFEAFTIPGGVILFYSYRTFYGVNKFLMYQWVNGEISNVEYYSINEFFAIPPKAYIFPNRTDDTFDIILTTMTHEGGDIVSEISKTKIRFFKVYLNGTARAGEHWVIDYEFDYLIDFDYENGTLYAQYRYMYDYNPNHLYFTIVTSMLNTSISNFMIISEGGFDPAFFVTEDGYLHTTLIREGTLYSLQYSVNESISFTDFNSTAIGMSHYSDRYMFKHDGYQTYIFNSEPYVGTKEFFADDDLKSKISILDHNHEQANLSEFFIYNVPELDNYHTFYALDYGNGETLFTHTTLLTQKDIPNRKYSASDFIGFYIESNITLSLPSEPITVNLVALTGFSLFWKTAGIYIVSILAGVAVIYVIFRKFFNRTIVGMKNYLLRPMKPQANAIASFFTNIWLFLFNGITTLYILFKTNKKRHLMNLIGMTVLAVIIITSTSIYSSKQKVLISEYTEDISVTNDGVPSLSIVMNYDTQAMGTNNPIISDFNEQAMSEVLTEFKLNYKTMASVIRSYEISTFMYMTAMDPLDNTTLGACTYYGISRNYTSILEHMLVNGSLPNNPGEIMMEANLAANLGFGVNDTVLFFGAIRDYYNYYLGDTNVSLTISGLYSGITLEDYNYLLDINDLPYDSAKGLNNIFFGPGVLSFIDNSLPNLDGLFPYYMRLTTYVQFIYDFTDFDPSQMTALKIEQEEIIENNVHFAEFNYNVQWSMSGELNAIIDVLEPKLESSIFLFFTLAVPILYLSLFLIFETNDLYSRSMEQEIEIFQAKGLSTFRIAWNYSLLKLVEAVFATAIGFALSLALIPPLLKMDSFISFNNPFVTISLSSLPLASAFTVFILVIISLPKIIQISSSKKVQQKTPQRVMKLFKRIRLVPIVLIGIGGGIIFGGIQLYNLLYSSVGENSGTILMSFIYIAGMGALFALLGIGLLLKDLHSIIMIIISKIAWNFRKTIRTFSLIEIRSDIHIFNNIFLTFFLLVGITLPSIICPLSVQFNFEKDAIFRTGTDMYVNNWLDQNTSLLPEIRNITGVNAVTNTSIVDAYYQGNSLNVLTIENLTEYLSVVEPPPKRMYRNWEKDLNLLASNRSMLVTAHFHQEVADDYDAFTFSDYDAEHVETMLIRGEFDYFPTFYETGPFTLGVTKRINALVMTQANYLWIEDTLIEFGRYKDRLMIQLVDGADYEEVKSVLEELGLNVESAAEEAEKTQFESYPFYSIIAAEFAISILICLIAIVFVSISNPIKILQQRTNKNDRLKKMGISTKKIIRLTAIETLISGVLPGVLLGVGFGYAIITLFITATQSYFYSGINFLLVFSPAALIISFIVAPGLFFGIFYLSMRRNYARYLPRNLE